MSEDIRRLSEELARDPASLAFLPLAEGLRRQGQLDLAHRIAVRGLERHPHLADGHDVLARILADRGELERAFDEWDMVLRLAPGHAGAQKGMGFILFNQGRLAEAEQYLAAAAADAPHDDTLHAALHHVRAAIASPELAPPPPEAPAFAPDDPRLLFQDALDAADQAAILLDRDGLVLGGAYYVAEGEDVAQEIGAALSGVSVEAERATRFLDIGGWRSIVFETEAATVAMAPSADEGVVVLAAGQQTPLGLVRRVLDRCVATATRWLGASGGGAGSR